MTWDDLKYWETGEWQVMEEYLDEWDRTGTRYNPKREDLFASMDAVPFDNVRVAILGQDPYPQAEYATGIAFSIPSGEKKFPPTLVNIFKEYVDDLHYKFPTNGDLTPWCEQGVLLYNCIPTCFTNKPGSHRNITEWSYLTKEVLSKLNQRGCIFVSLGGIARSYLPDVIDEKSTVLSYSHPSPLGVTKSNSPFFGSRLFSTINDKLDKPIDWKLE